MMEANDPPHGFSANTEGVSDSTGGKAAARAAGAALQKDRLTAVFFFVVMDGIEPPTQGFSVLCSTI